MSLTEFIAGQSILLSDLLLRIGFIINQQEEQGLHLFALLIPRKEDNNLQQLIDPDNRKSTCDNILLFGMANHWIYEIDLRCLKNQYQRLVLAIITKQPSSITEQSQAEITINIEHVGIFHSKCLLTSSRIWRVAELYLHQGQFKIKMYSDFYSLDKFASIYYSPNNTYQVVNSIKHVSEREKSSSFLGNLISGRLFDSDSNATYKVAVIGSQGIGKTSVLATMHDQLCKVRAISKLKILHEDEGIADNLLKNTLDKIFLANRCSDTNAQSTQTTLEEKHLVYKTTLIQESTSFDLNLEFMESLRSSNNSLLNESNINIIKDSQVVIFPIDTIALIEHQGRWNESINRARELTDLCKRAFINVEDQKLILLVPVKCENYMADRTHERLITSIEEHYAGFFNFISKLSKFVACALTPVQTIGNIILAHIDEEDSQPEYRFVPSHSGATYSPRDADQLWTYILTFVLAQLLRSYRMKLLLAPPNAVHDSLNLLLTHRKQGADGFKIYQGMRAMS